MNEMIKKFVFKLLEINNVMVFEYHHDIEMDNYIFDTGIRKNFYVRDVYKDFLDKIYSESIDYTVYFYTDEFLCSYTWFRVPETDTLWMIGPYVSDVRDEKTLERLTKTLGIPDERNEEFCKLYRTLPPIENNGIFLNFIHVLAGEIYGEHRNYNFSYLENKKYYDIEIPFLVKEEDTVTSIKNIELRYGIMRNILDEVRRGNESKALQHLARYTTLTEHPRFQNRLHDTKNWLIIFNTSLKLAAENAGIHPYYLNQLSKKYSFKIDALQSASMRKTMMQDMVRKYCMMINNQNLSGYSPVIQKVLLKINLELESDISLKKIAEDLNMNASYLSDLFKREMGVTLTEYINRKRINESMKYLNQINIPIKSVAQYVGIYDFSYYNKLFKKYVGMTPKEYRNMITVSENSLDKLN